LTDERGRSSICGTCLANTGSENVGDADNGTSDVEIAMTWGMLSVAAKTLRREAEKKQIATRFRRSAENKP
jgi:hypothetical protein